MRRVEGRLGRKGYSLVLSGGRCWDVGVAVVVCERKVGGEGRVRQ